MMWFNDLTLPEWLLIVRRDRPHVFENLRQSFAYDQGVQVILDRREADRRRTGVIAEPERRAQQRRHPPPATEAAFGKNAGFWLIERR